MLTGFFYLFIFFAVKTGVGYVQPHDSGLRANNQINIQFIDQSNRVKRAKILADDWQRDPRNAERRKVIKRETYQRRDSLADSLLIAKGIIDGHAKNKQYEKKAKERRRVIKTRCSAPGSNRNQRRLSFLEELQTAQEVVAPKWDYKQSVERSKNKCRAIKQQFAGKRRPSLQEEIGVARDVIVDSERRKRSLPTEVVQEVDFSFLLFVFCISVSLYSGEHDGTVVRELSSHPCGSGSTPTLVICVLNLFLVLVVSPRGFSMGAPVFPSPEKDPTFPNSNSSWRMPPITV